MRGLSRYVDDEYEWASQMTEVRPSAYRDNISSFFSPKMVAWTMTVTPPTDAHGVGLFRRLDANPPHEKHKRFIDGGMLASYINVEFPTDENEPHLVLDQKHAVLTYHRQVGKTEGMAKLNVTYGRDTAFSSIVARDDDGKRVSIKKPTSPNSQLVNTKENPWLAPIVARPSHLKPPFLQSLLRKTQ